MFRFIAKIVIAAIGFIELIVANATPFKAVDTGGARGAMAPPLFWKIILFFLQNIVFHHRVYGFCISIIGFITF